MAYIRMVGEPLGVLCGTAKASNTRTTCNNGNVVHDVRGLGHCQMCNTQQPEPTETPVPCASYLTTKRRLSCSLNVAFTSPNGHQMLLGCVPNMMGGAG